MSKIKIIKDKDGNSVGVDINNSQTIKNHYNGKPGKDGAPGKDGHDGQTGTPGTPGKPGRDALPFDPTIVKELQKSLSSAEKKTDKRITGIANINKSIRSDITQLDENFVAHIDNNDVHFDDLIQKTKVLDHLDEDHIRTIISGGGGSPPHNNLQGLDGGNGLSGTGEYYHLTEEDYNTATKILQTPNSLTDIGRIDFGENSEASIYFDGQDLVIGFTNPSLGNEEIVRINDDLTVEGSITSVGDLKVGSDIGVAADTDLLQLAADEVIINGDLDLNGGNIIINAAIRDEFGLRINQGRDNRGMAIYGFDDHSANWCDFSVNDSGDGVLRSLRSFQISSGTGGGNFGITVKTSGTKALDINFNAGTGSIRYWGGGSTTKLTVDSSGNVVMAGDLTVGGDTIVGGTNPVSLFEVDGPIGLAIQTVTGNTTLDNTHSTLLVNASGNVVITLPTAASAYNSTDGIGRIYRIKKIDNDADTVTIDGNGSETIDGGLTAILTVQYETITVQTDGSNWHIL